MCAPSGIDRIVPFTDQLGKTGHNTTMNKHAQRRSNAHHKNINQIAHDKIERKFGSVPEEQYVSSRIILRTATVLSTTAIGTLNSTIVMDPSSAVGWAEVSTYYDQFRVIGAKLQMYCLAPNSVTRICDLIIVTFDNDDQSALTSTGQAYARADKLIFPSVYQNHPNGVVFSAVRPATKTSTIDWVTINSPAGSVGAFKFFSETLDVSTNILRVFIEYYVEVRGRR